MCHRVSILLAMVVMVGVFSGAVGGQQVVSEPVTVEQGDNIELMLAVVSSSTTERKLRYRMARSLLYDSQAHPGLISILNDEEETEARVIVCRAIAGMNGDGLFGPMAISGRFIDPLFCCLLSEHAELAEAAGKALARFQQPEVVVRLSELVRDPSLPVANRRACIATLELIPGKAPLLALGELLADEDPQLRERAAGALATMLPLPSDITAAAFQNRYMPMLQEMDEQTILFKQGIYKQDQLQDAQEDIDAHRRRYRYWQQRYLDAKQREFEGLTDSTKRLEYLQQFLQQSQGDVLLRRWVLQRVQDWTQGAGALSNAVDQRLSGFLRGLIDDSDPVVRRLTAESLLKLGEAGRDCSEALLSQLQVELEPEVQASIIETLGGFQYGPAAKAVLTHLQSPSDQVVSAAAQALGRLAGAAARPIGDEAIEEIVEGLIMAFERQSGTVSVQLDILAAMSSVAGVEDYRGPAKAFDPILRGLLGSSEPGLRRRAVQALTLMYQGKALPLLLDGRNLLEDEDPGVCFAVVEAIQKYGGEEHLDRLRQRLVRETANDDLARALRKAYIRILDSLPLEQCYQRVSRLDDASTGLQALRDQSALLLLEKIREARTQNQPVPVAYEQLALMIKADIFERQQQPEQAINTYRQLVGLPLAEEVKDGYRERIVLLGLTGDSRRLLQEITKEMGELIERGAADPVLSRIRQLTDSEATQDDAQAVRAGQVLTHLIVPVDRLASASEQAFWSERAREVALVLIEHLAESLISEESRVNTEVVKLLKRLDPRLTNYPFYGTLAERRERLKEFRLLLNPSAGSTTEAPEATVQAETEPLVPLDTEQSNTTD